MKCEYRQNTITPARVDPAAFKFTISPYFEKKIPNTPHWHIIIFILLHVYNRRTGQYIIRPCNFLSKPITLPHPSGCTVVDCWPGDICARHPMHCARALSTAPAFFFKTTESYSAVHVQRNNSYLNIGIQDQYCWPSCSAKIFVL